MSEVKLSNYFFRINERRKGMDFVFMKNPNKQQIQWEEVKEATSKLGSRQLLSK